VKAEPIGTEASGTEERRPERACGPQVPMFAIAPTCVLKQVMVASGSFHDDPPT
jgi:hypothetical protein